MRNPTSLTGLTDIMVPRSIKRFFLIASFTAAGGWACAQTSSSYGELQAAYMYNFAKYVKWPQEGNTFVVGIYGEVENMDALKNILVGKKVRNKPIELVILNDLGSIGSVSILYLPESASNNIRALIKAAEGKNILIVTEADLIKKGAIISFVVEDDHLKFKLNQAALQQIGLIASEGLLKLAILQ